MDLTDAQTILTEMTTLQQEVISIVTAFVARNNVAESAFTGAGFFAITNFKHYIDVSTCIFFKSSTTE